MRFCFLNTGSVDPSKKLVVVVNVVVVCKLHTTPNVMRKVVLDCKPHLARLPATRCSCCDDKVRGMGRDQVGAAPACWL